MYFLIFILTVIIVYIRSFKDSFNKEQIQKVGNIIILVAVVLIIISVISSILLH